MATDAPVHFLNIIPSADNALGALNQPLQQWFRASFPSPTPGQRLAWLAITQGHHVLLAAPTGSGKTLAAFLPILSGILDEKRPGLQCLYVAPLKALCADAAKNLRKVVQQLTPLLPADAEPLHVGLRTGDTSSATRRRLLEQPPAILLTTPENLAVMLTQDACLRALRTVRWIVVDEVHAFAQDKRGADLSLSLERLDHVVREAGHRAPQRLGLSATCVPLPTVAHFLAGAGRVCHVAQVVDDSPFTLDVDLLPHQPGGCGFIGRLLDRLQPELEGHRTTLIFADVRSLAERLTWQLKKRWPAWSEQIAVHHSSLAAGQRRHVEERLKAGELRVVVTSTSLELGIDIGAVEQVVLIHPPGGVARLLQRLGRSGHGPGRLRKGLILAAQPAELLEGAVTAASSRSAQLEPLPARPPALDVLCQQLVGIAMTGSWTADEVLGLVRRAHPYRNLRAVDLRDCLDYLSGLHADGQTWLPPRLRWHGDRFTIVDMGTARLLRRNLGTIVSAEERRAVRLVVHAENMPADAEPSYLTLGDLDEGYADSLQPGDRFLLDGRCLEYRRREGQALMVEEQSTRPSTPRWGSGPWYLAPELAQRIFVERNRAAEAGRGDPAELQRFFLTEWNLRGEAANDLADWLTRQESASEVPSLARQLLEVVPAADACEYFWHTPFNRAGNAAIASVLAWRLERDHNIKVHPWPANLGFLLVAVSSRELGANTWRALTAAENWEQDLSNAWNDSPALRERFARTTQVGLMVLRNPLGGRRKVGGSQWVQRHLFEQIQDQAPQFVLLRQALSELAQDGAALEQARRFFDTLPGRPLLCRRLPQISPFASAWFDQPFIEETPVTPREEVLFRLARELTRMPQAAG